MDSGGIETLTEPEKEVLRLFLVTSDPKEIAAKLDRSHHAVDQRLRSARAKLSVKRTIDAARQLAAYEGGDTYEAAAWRSFVGGEPDRHKFIKPGSERVGVLHRLFPLRGRPWLAEPIWPRIVAISVGVILLMVAAILCVSLGEALTRIVRR